jgi:hypothetical protein
MSAQDLAAVIYAEIANANGLYAKAMDLLKMADPASNMTPILTKISTAMVMGATAFLTLFFLVELFVKTANKGLTKLEDIAMFVAKTGIASALVTQSGKFMTLMYEAFHSFFTLVSTTGTAGEKFFVIKPETAEGAYYYILGKPDYDALVANPGWFDLNGLTKWLGLMPSFLILKVVMLLVTAIVIGVIMELLIYTVAAPIPLSTFVSESVNDVGKSFLKKFAAVVLQATVIAIMFQIFGSLTGTLKLDAVTSDGSTKMLLLSIVLALGVFKSGSWAKSLTGAM